MRFREFLDRRVNGTFVNISIIASQLATKEKCVSVDVSFNIQEIVFISLKVSMQVRKIRPIQASENNQKSKSRIVIPAFQ